MLLILLLALLLRAKKSRRRDEEDVVVVVFVLSAVVGESGFERDQRLGGAGLRSHGTVALDEVHEYRPTRSKDGGADAMRNTSTVSSSLSNTPRATHHPWTSQRQRRALAS